MINKKTIFLLLFLILILVLILIAQIVIRERKENKQVSPPPILFEEPKSSDTRTGLEGLTVMGVSPDSKTPISDRYQPIEITLNKPLNEATIKLSLIPNNNIKIRLSKTKLGDSFLEIIPISPWTDNQNYQITLDKDLQATDGTKLGNSYIINFTVKAYLGL